MFTLSFPNGIIHFCELDVGLNASKKMQWEKTETHKLDNKSALYVQIENQRLWCSDTHTFFCFSIDIFDMEIFIYPARKRKMLIDYFQWIFYYVIFWTLDISGCFNL